MHWSDRRDLVVGHTYGLLSPVHACCPQLGVVTELHLIRVNHVPTAQQTSIVVKRKKEEQLLSSTFTFFFLETNYFNPKICSYYYTGYYFYEEKYQIILIELLYIF